MHHSSTFLNVIISPPPQHYNHLKLVLTKEPRKLTRKHVFVQRRLLHVMEKATEKYMTRGKTAIYLLRAEWRPIYAGLV